MVNVEIINDCLIPKYIFLIAEDIFLLSTRDERNPLVYGVFTTTRYVLGSCLALETNDEDLTQDLHTFV